MPYRLHIRAIVFGLLCFLVLLSPAGAQKPKLTRAKVDELIKIEAPDELIANQIRSNGLSFAVNRKILDAFTKEGAGPLTMAALREQYRVGTVQLRTVPGGAVLLDGKDVGTADRMGVIVIQDVQAGDHELAASSDGYHDGHLQFSLANQEQKQLILPLDWLGGYLSVSAQPAGATIRISGPRSFDSAVSQMKIPPGNYAVNVSLDGYLTQTRSFQVAAGEDHNETFHLEIDRALLDRITAEAKDKMTSDPVSAMADLQRVIRIDPSRTATLAILAEADLRAGMFGDFVANGARAIRAGGTVDVPLTHRHAGVHGFVHDVTLVLSREGMAFQIPASVNGCKLPSTLQPYGSLSRLVFESELYREMGVQNTTPDLALEFGFIQPKKFTIITSSVDYDSAGNLLKWYDVDAPGSKMGPHSYSPLQTPYNAEQYLDAVVALINKVRN